MLLAVFEERRPTRDVDLLGMAIANDAASVAALVTEITAIEVDDGVVFRPDQRTTQRSASETSTRPSGSPCPPPSPPPRLR